MKRGIIAPIVTALFLLLISSCSTQVHTQTRAITVEAMSDDISYNLDLRAVASVFADSRNLEDFEYRLNDYNSGISNLDLNRDGQIDYLRVVEMYENGVRLVVVQAVLGYNVFQDVATIVVEGRNQNNIRVQIVGDPFIYGANYIIEPVFYHSPIIYNVFWGPSYIVWRSPYYWGYYPQYYHYRTPVRTNIYVNNIHVHVNVNNNYKYTNKVRNQRAVNRMQTTVRRNDYATRNPGQSFSNRNTSVKNTREMQTRDTRSSSSRNTNATTNSGRSSSSSRDRNTTTNTRQNTNSNTRSNTESTRSNSSGSSRQTTTQPGNSTESTRESSGTRTNSSNSNSTRQTTQPSDNGSTTRPSSSSSSSRQTTTQPSSSTTTRQNNRSSTSTSRSSNSSTTVNSNNSNSRSSSSSTTTRSSGSGSNSSSSSGSNSRSSGK